MRARFTLLSTKNIYKSLTKTRCRVETHRFINASTCPCKLILILFVWYFLVFYVLFGQHSYFKCSWRATVRCLAGRIWPAGRTSSRPDLDRRLKQCFSTFWASSPCKWQIFKLMSRSKNFYGIVSSCVYVLCTQKPPSRCSIFKSR